MVPVVVVFCVLVFSAAAIGGAATSNSVGDWYKSLATPTWTPPSWLFGPVWTVLYVMMIVSASLAALAIKRRRADRRLRALFVEPMMVLFVAQLVLNALWSVAFFGMRSPWLAVAVIAALVLAIAMVIVGFSRVSPLAAWLLGPYLAWVCFAAALNVSIATLN